MSRKEFTHLKMNFGEALNVDSTLTPTAHRVARQLIKHLNSESGLAWPGAERLATDLNVSIRSVRRAIAELTKPGGWFIKEQRGGRGRSNRYAMNPERVTAVSPFEHVDEDERVTVLNEKGDKIARKSVPAVSPESLNRTPEKNSVKDSPAASRSGSEARARHGLKPETKNARQRDRDALPPESLKANTPSRAQWSNLVATRRRELANNWDLGLSAEERTRADELLKRSNFS